MTYSLGAFENEKTKIFLISLLMSLITCLLIGLPLFFILNYFEINTSIWLPLIFVVIIFPLLSYIYYKSSCKRNLKK